MWKEAIIFTYFVYLVVSQPTWNVTGDGYIFWCLGNCHNDIQTKTIPGTILMGGGLDVDDAYIWMIQNSGGGDIVILRTTGTAAYNPYIYSLGKVNSVSTILLTSRNASYDPFVRSRVSQCEGLYFAGGDQWTYYSQWKYSPLNDIFNTLYAKGITIGGTSAGMAIQPSLIYSAEFGSVTSDEALANPYDLTITIGENFLPNKYLLNTITDTHFYQRDRMGRLVTFLARMWQDVYVGSVAHGIACSEKTAVLIDNQGQAHIVTIPPLSGHEFAYFLTASEPPEICQNQTTLTYSNIQVTKMGKNDGIFSMTDWTSNGGTKYSLYVNKGILDASGNGGNIY